MGHTIFLSSEGQIFEPHAQLMDFLFTAIWKFDEQSFFACAFDMLLALPFEGLVFKSISFSFLHYGFSFFYESLCCN
jgi:hypothetical protein